MPSAITEQTCYTQLREACRAYYDFSDASFEAFKRITFVKTVEKGNILQDTYSKARYIYFICKGILRTYYLSEEGTTYTKNLFGENGFSASKVSLLTGEDSYLSIEALEESTLIFIDFVAYQTLIETNGEFKDFYIRYLEKNWVIVKEKNEISLILDDAMTRYRNFLRQNPEMEKRIPLHYIADHLGITPTQLSRIRRKLKEERQGLKR